MAEPFVGEIRIFAGDYAPQGWHFCDGALLNISDYTVLYAVLGTVYGGDGRVNFGLPDLRGRAALSIGKAAPSGTTYVAAQKGGSETVTLTVANIPSHTHAFNAVPVAAVTANAGENVMLATANTAGEVVVRYLPADKTASSNPALNPATVGSSAGGSTPLDNMMPSFAVSYIIALNGIYPTAS